MLNPTKNMNYYKNHNKVQLKRFVKTAETLPKTLETTEATES